MVPFLNERQVQKLLSLNWKGPHSARLQREIGDPQLVVAFRGDINRWLLARVERVRVNRTFGSSTVPSYEDLPVVWKIWQDDDGSFLDITDPRLVPYIRKCDGTTGGAERMKAAIEIADKTKEAREQAAIAEMVDDMVDRIKVFRRLADDAGIVPHRKGGHEGGKISSASLWRGGAVAPRIVLA